MAISFLIPDTIQNATGIEGELIDERAPAEPKKAIKAYILAYFKIKRFVNVYEMCKCFFLLKKKKIKLMNIIDIKGYINN